MIFLIDYLNEICQINKTFYALTLITHKNSAVLDSFNVLVENLSLLLKIAMQRIIKHTVSINNVLKCICTRAHNRKKDMNAIHSTQG